MLMISAALLLSYGSKTVVFTPSKQIRNESVSLVTINGTVFATTAVTLLGSGDWCRGQGQRMKSLRKLSPLLAACRT